MSLNLTLTKEIESAPGKSVTLECHLWLTPTSLTKECQPILNDRWQVFNKYQEWMLPNARGLSKRWRREHLDTIQQALRDGYEWSWI